MRVRPPLAILATLGLGAGPSDPFLVASDGVTWNLDDVFAEASQ